VAHVGLVHVHRTTQVALVLRGLLGEDVALERLTALDGTPGRTRNRLAALFLVFILGMTAPSLLLLQATPKPPVCLLACSGLCSGPPR
jgi:hypothetical protein